MELGARIDPDKVSAYIRWSTEEQTQGTTLEVQRSACENYIRSQGWTFNPALVFVDDGHSGATLDRPAMSALRLAVKRGKVECVVTYTLDRLSRSVLDTIDLVLKEWEGRCFIRCVQQPIDTSHPSGKMFFYMLASYAEFEREMIRMRTMSGKKRRAGQGANAGWRYNFGYTRGAAPGTYQISPQEAEIVRGLFQDYLAGKGPKELAQHLTAKGIMSPTGKRWAPNAIRSMLSNPVYMGRLEYGKERRIRRDGKTVYIRSKSPVHANVEDAVPALISKSLWERVQQRRRERAGHTRRTLSPSSYLLSGIAQCGGCGRPVAGVASRQVRYYRCIGRRDFGEGFCKAAALQADPIEELIAERLRAELSSESLEVAIQTMVTRQEEAVRVARAHLEVLESELDSVSQAHRRVDKAFDAGELDPRVYSRRSVELEERARALGQKVEEARAHLEDLQLAVPPAEHLQQLCEQVDAWEHLDPSERKTLLREAVETLTVFRESVGKGRKKNPHPLRVELALRI